MHIVKAIYSADQELELALIQKTKGTKNETKINFTNFIYKQLIINFLWWKWRG